MNKIESVMELYKTVFPDVRLKKKGSWIRVYKDDGGSDVYSSFYSDELISEIFNKTGNVYRWDAENKTLDLYAAHSDTLWDTGDNWNTNDGWSTEETKEEENIFDDIGEL